KSTERRNLDGAASDGPIPRREVTGTSFDPDRTAAEAHTSRRAHDVAAVDGHWEQRASGRAPGAFHGRRSGRGRGAPCRRPPRRSIQPRVVAGGEIFGIDHADAAARVLKAWPFPADVI